MLLVISPAKNLDFETPPVTAQITHAEFLEHSQQLINELRVLAPQDISVLMSISDKLGVLNYDRFQQWQMPFTTANAKQALLAFNGDVYTGLQATTFDTNDFEFAQQHLRILSGLYGLLRPLDLIQPYRLEMGTKFANVRGKNLYTFWGAIITDALNQQLQRLNSRVLVNLASNEYFSSVHPKQLTANIITPVFKDGKGGQYKIVSFYAKKARGLMAAYIIKNKITEVEAIKCFDSDGYCYNPGMSNANEWVFTRQLES